MNLQIYIEWMFSFYLSATITEKFSMMKAGDNFSASDIFA